MNCPHATESEAVCRECHDALIDALTQCADITRALAECTHEHERPMLEAPYVWCPDCGSFRLATQPGVWAIPKSVNRAKDLDGTPTLHGITEAS